jgi:hypothetical protein
MPLPKRNGQQELSAAQRGPSNDVNMLWGKLQTIPASALKPENRTKQNRVKRNVTIYCQFCPLTIRKKRTGYSPEDRQGVIMPALNKG